MPTEPTEPKVTTLALLDLAERLGSLADQERAWFEITSRWAAEAVDARATRLLATLSVHHGWRFDLLVHRLPSIGGEPVSSWLGRSAELPGRSEAQASSATGDAARIERLAAVVLPGLLAEVDSLAAPVDPRVDGPTHRMLEQCRHDLLSDIDAARAAR